MKKRNLLFHLLLTVIVLVVLTHSKEETTLPEIIFKPMIMVWISTYFIVNLGNKTHSVVKPALFAFFFAWLGDIALLFDGTLFFLTGLSSFLVAHLFYIYLFQQTEDRIIFSLLWKWPVWIVPFALYGIILLKLLLRNVDTIFIPAIVTYTVTLLAMAASALNRHHRVATESFVMVLAGAIFFVFSDSLIAINKFAVEVPNTGFWVMLTYILAQYLIMSGLLAQVNRNTTA